MIDEDDAEFVNLGNVDIKDFGGLLGDANFKHFYCDLEQNLLV